jgi:alcohol dehydrogenase class IV
MAVPKAIAEYLSNLKSEIKKVQLEDHTYLIVAARHCAETCRRYMALTTQQSIAIDNVVHKCSDLVEALKVEPSLAEADIKKLRRAALGSIDELSETVADAEPLHEATILHLTRK